MASEITVETPGPLVTARKLAGRIKRRLTAMVERKEGWDWAIGLYAGPSPLALAPMDGVRNPIIAARDVRDVPASFVADPFLIRRDGRWWLFFEVMNTARNKGEIALASSADLSAWRYERVVLSEPFHLSYPQVFEWEGALYMVPESFEAGAVRLYRAEDFPWQWRPVATLDQGRVMLDSTLFRHDGRWWMLSETNPEHRYDCLRMFHSERLDGGWREHPASPIVPADRAIARPAGSVIHWEGRPVRFAQDCVESYGVRVRAFAIEELTPTAYRERPLGVALERGRQRWCRSGMHHLDAKQDGARWIACVDGR